MATRSGGNAEARPPLSRNRVLQTAISLADDSGLDALTMRRLGQALGVEAMSLYNHVASKDDLLNGIVDVVVGEIALPTAGTDWKTAIRASAISAHDVLMRHPWACALLLSPARVRPGRLRQMEALLSCLRHGGFSANLTHHAYHALDSYILGFTLWVASIAVDRDEMADVGATVLRDLSVADYPYLIEHIEQHLGDSDDDVSEFAFGLDLILDGLERLRDAA